MKRYVQILSATIIFIMLSSEALTQVDPSHPELAALEQSGKLLTVKLVPSAKNVNIYIVGKETAKIDLKKLKIEVSSLSTPSKTYAVKSAHDYFIAEKLDLAQQNEIEVKTHLEGQQETFKFKVNNQPR